MIPPRSEIEVFYISSYTFNSNSLEEKLQEISNGGWTIFQIVPPPEDIVGSNYKVICFQEKSRINDYCGEY